MKEHTQTMGIRKWAGDDLIELQQEPLDALQALVTPYAPCIIQGCVPTPNDDGKTHTVSPGFVALKGKIVRFDGMAKAILPLHLGLDCKTVNRVYADGGNKPIKYHYVAKELNEDTADDSCLTITADDSSNPHLVDAMGITQKLDREGGNASNVKVVSFVSDTAENLSNIEAGSTLKELFGKIRRWFSALGKLAFKNTVGTSDFDEDLKTAFSNKVDKDGDKVLSDLNFSQADKDKLDGIAEGANNYTHPTTAGNNHIPAGGSSGQYLKYSSAGTAAWATPTASEIGAAASSHSHNDVTQNAAGFMSSTDKSKLDGIATGANNYTHPTTAGNKHIPSGGSTGQYLKYSAAGTAAWASPASNTATTSAAGFMSSADKSKLDGIASGANNYTHPTTAGNNHIPAGGSSGQYLKYSAAGTAAWASPASNLATTSAAGFMSAADKKQLTDFQIVGIYFMATGDIQYGFKSEPLTYKKATHGSEKCLSIKMPPEAGTYMIIPLAPQSRYYITTYDIRWSAGSDAIVFHRNPNGEAGYYDFGVGFMLVKTTLSLTA